MKTILSINLGIPSLTTGMSLANTVNENSDMIVTSPEFYDLKDNKIQAFRYDECGLHYVGNITPEADIWILWTDGYRVNHQNFGFAKKLDHYFAMLNFFEKNLREGNIGSIYNSPQAERRTLKNFLTEEELKKEVIPTYLIRTFEELQDLFTKRKIIVIKPILGGARRGIKKIEKEQDLKPFKKLDITEYIAQDYYPGAEKRMWIIDGKFVEGRIMHGRQTPWSEESHDYDVNYYNGQTDSDQAKKDIATTNKVAEIVGINFGAIDFIGDKVNEVNGAGTSFIGLDRLNKIKVDARPHLCNYIKSLIKTL